MSNKNYITNILNLKEENLIFKENFYHEQKIKDITHKVFEAYLSYKPTHCTKCGVLFDDKFEKHGFITSNIKIPDISGFKSILKLHKQRYLCKHCNKAFTLSTNIVNYGCFISNNTKYKIATDLVKKRSEKDVALDNNVSPNTVERVMDSYYETQKLYKNYLPEVLCFDEFKSVKSADGAMSFHMCDGITGQTIDIIEDRRLNKLINYFFYYNFKARSKVKFIIIDMYSPYVSLIKKMFPNAKIIIDKFHLAQLISRSLNKNRIMAMKKLKKHHRKFKRYWRLILKYRDDLDISIWKKWTCFDHLMTEADIVDYLINLDDELRQTYLVYQDILHALKEKNYQLLKFTLSNYPTNISDYMKTSIKTLTEFLPFIKNTLNNNYHNGYIEGNNNFIKVIKRIAFGFRSFRRFKARIMICKGILKIKKIANA
jgi:transposase